MNEINLLDLLKAVWKKHRTITKYGLIGAVLGLLIAFCIPKEYSSSVQLVPENSEDQGRSMGSMGALAGMVGVNIGSASASGITPEIYPEILKSVPFMIEFAAIQVPFEGKNTTLYNYLSKEQRKPWWSVVFQAPMTFIGWITSWGSTPQTANDTVVFSVYAPTLSQAGFEQALSKRISAEQDKKTGVLTLRAEMQDPVVAAFVADSLYSKLKRYMADYRTEKARHDLRFSEKLYQEAQEKYYKADMAYAEASDQNQNLIRQSAKVKIERLSQERDIAYSIYQQMSTQVETNRVKVQEQTPIATVLQPARIPIRADSPSKMMYMIGFGILFGLVAVSIIGAKAVVQLQKKQ